MFYESTLSRWIFVPYQLKKNGHIETLLTVLNEQSALNENQNLLYIDLMKIILWN